jgi:hypothetical protein
MKKGCLANEVQDSLFLENRSLSAAAFFVIWFEQRLVDTADRAYPVIRQIFERRAGLYTAVRIADFGIVDITAWNTYPFLHIRFSVYIVENTIERQVVS